MQFLINLYNPVNIFVAFYVSTYYNTVCISIGFWQIPATITIGADVFNGGLEKMIMKNMFCFKKAAVIISAAALLATGIPGLSSVTAMAATVSAGQANVRTSPVDGEAVDVLPEGRTVDIVDSTIGSDGNTWYQVTYVVGEETLGGWVRADLLSDDDSAAEAAAEAEEIEELTEAVEEAEEAAENAEEAAAEAVTSEEEAAAAAAEAEESAEAAETANEPVATGGSGAASYVISSSIPNDVIPDGFQKTTVSYEGKDVSALVMNSAEVYLLYMEDSSGSAAGRLVVYDLSKSELIPYICFPTNDGFILLLNIPDAELASVSDRFGLTTCSFEGGTIDALQMTQRDAVISESANLTDFYFMYGVNRDGRYGWYVYNSAEGDIEETILSMHYNLAGTGAAEEEERSRFSLDSLSIVVIVGIIVIFLLLLILVIIFGVRYRQLAKEIDEMETRKASRHSSGSGSGSTGTSSRGRGGDGSKGSRGSASAKSSAPPAQGSAPSDTQDFSFSAGLDQDTTPGASTEPLKDDAAPDSQPSRKSSRKSAETADDDDDLTFL